MMFVDRGTGNAHRHSYRAAVGKKNNPARWVIRAGQANVGYTWHGYKVFRLEEKQ